jgi:hypothetical protein
MNMPDDDCPGAGTWGLSGICGFGGTEGVAGRAGWTG